MYKKFLALLVITMIIFAGIPAMAADQPVVFKDTITVTADGGRYQVGFVNLEFKKEFIDASKLPATFNVEVFAKNGEVGVQITPSTPEFFKKVHIRVDSYKGLLYDKEKGENIQVNIKKQQVLAEHFSWFRFR